MKIITLGSRPDPIAPKVTIYDFECDCGSLVRVSMKLESVERDEIKISAQAYEIDADGRFLNAPDGRPSRTEGTEHNVQKSGLGSAAAPGTHTLNPGWVRVVGDYDIETFDQSAPRGEGVPQGEPIWDVNTAGKYYDTATGIGYRWDKGEKVRIAHGKVDELLSIIANSNVLSDIEF